MSDQELAEGARQFLLQTRGLVALAQRLEEIPAALAGLAETEGRTRKIKEQITALAAEETAARGKVEGVLQELTQAQADLAAVKQEIEDTKLQISTTARAAVQEAKSAVTDAAKVAQAAADAKLQKTQTALDELTGTVETQRRELLGLEERAAKVRGFLASITKE